MLGDGTSLSTNATYLYGTTYNTIELNSGWQYDSRNRGLFADRGQRHTAALSVVPTGSVAVLHRQLYYGCRLHAAGTAQYAVAGPDPGLWRQRWAALPRCRPTSASTPVDPMTVRAYYDSSLGPVDTRGNPYGGNLMTVARAELILPLPLKWQTSARATLFYDMGNVFSDRQHQVRWPRPADPGRLQIQL